MTLAQKILNAMTEVSTDENVAETTLIEAIEKAIKEYNLAAEGKTRRVDWDKVTIKEKPPEFMEFGEDLND